nr:reverse transcriptase domain-containing protein [Tanacetum cinerariifolium]
MKTELKNEFKTTMLNQNNELRNLMSNEIKNMMSSFIQMQSPSGSGLLPSNTVANPRGDLKAITTRSGVTYDGATIPPTPSPLLKEVKCKTEATKDKVQPTSSESTAHVQPSVVQIPILEPKKKLSLSKLNDEAITFKVRHTSRYSRNFYKKSVNQIDVIDVSCEEYAQEVLEFSNSSKSGNPTPSDPIISSFSPSFTPFEGSDFILEEIETFLRTQDELSTLDDDFDQEGDIALIEKLPNEDPSLNIPSMKNEDLKHADVTMTKPSTEELPKLKLKDLPSNLEYSFLEGTDKLPVIISKELKDEEKTAL